jgi:hypothetical protein
VYSTVTTPAPPYSVCFFSLFWCNFFYLRVAEFSELWFCTLCVGLLGYALQNKSHHNTENAFYCPALVRWSLWLFQLPRSDSSKNHNPDSSQLIIGFLPVYGRGVSPQGSRFCPSAITPHTSRHVWATMQQPTKLLAGTRQRPRGSGQGAVL